MKFTPKHKLAFSGILMLLAIAVLAMSTAFVGVPALSKWSGINETYLTYVAAIICFIVAVAASRAVRKMTEAGGKND